MLDSEGRDKFIQPVMNPAEANEIIPNFNSKTEITCKALNTIKACYHV